MRLDHLLSKEHSTRTSSGRRIARSATNDCCVWLMGGTFDNTACCGGFPALVRKTVSAGLLERVGGLPGVFSSCTLLGFEGPGPCFWGWTGTFASGGVGVVFWACWFGTCCLGWWDCSYVENYTVDASICNSPHWSIFLDVWGGVLWSTRRTCSSSLGLGVCGVFSLLILM